MQWLEVPDTTNRKVPGWVRSAGLADDGTVYVPAKIAGDEMAAVLSASWDGVDGVVSYRGHPFLPADWVKKEHPHTRELCEKIEYKVKRAFSGKAEDQ